MALRQPLALENAAAAERPNADEFRLMLQALLGDAATSSLTSAGVVGATAFAVSEKSGTPDMSVDVAAGLVFIEGTESSPGGLYHVYNDATANLVVPAADATNPRKDLVIVRIRDSAESGSDDDAQLVLVQGTAAASPVEPDLDALGYENYHTLALVDVPATDTAITDSQITDRRTASLAWSRGRGEIDHASLTTDQTGVTTEVDVTGATSTFVAVAGRKYRISFDISVFVSTNVDTIPGVNIDRGGTNIYTRNIQMSKLDSAVPWSGFIRDIPGAGSVTYKLEISRTIGSGTVSTFVNTHKGTWLVEDIGGTLT